MPMIECPPGVWTDIPASGDTLLEARGIGFYVDASGAKPANPAEGYALASNEAMVSSSATLAVQPAQNVLSVVAYYEPA